MTSPEPAPIFSIRISRYPGDENPRYIDDAHDFDVDEGHLLIDHSRTEDTFTRTHFAPTGWTEFEVVGVPNPKPKPDKDHSGRGPRRNPNDPYGAPMPGPYDR